MRQIVNKILGKLLYYANNNPDSIACKSYFYDVKKIVLNKYGRLIGTDIQYIKKDCYRCDNGFYTFTHIFQDGGTFSEKRKCFHCNGTGIYKEETIFLDRFKLGKFTFYIPVKRIEGDQRNLIDKTGKVITDYIRHNKTSIKLSKECFLILAFLFYRNTFKYFLENSLLYSHEFNKSYYPLTFLLWKNSQYKRFKKFILTWFELIGIDPDFYEHSSYNSEYEPKPLTFFGAFQYSLEQNYHFSINFKKTFNFNDEYNDIPPF